MAILQKIRNQSVLLLVVVGVAMFAFIIGDFLNSGATYFNKSRENIGKVNGEAIHILDLICHHGNKHSQDYAKECSKKIYVNSFHIL